MNTHVRDNLLDLNGTTSVWTAYTPVLTAATAPALSSAVGRSKRIGNRVTVQFEVVASGTAASGIWTVSLPVTPRTLAGSTPLGIGTLFYAAQYAMGSAFLSGSTCAFIQSTATALFTRAVASGDSAFAVLTYEV